MSTFERYYKDLLEWEGVPFTPLIAQWNDRCRSEIIEELTQAIEEVSLKGKIIMIRSGSNNQSVGNQIAEFFVAEVNTALESFKIINCPGNGYPDKMLIDLSTSKRFPLELKATSCWDSTDANRRVLTSSSKKLRETFSSPLHHILLTVCYDVKGIIYKISRIRLDFIEPSSQVNVRLEASVNHKILSLANHSSVTI